MERTTNNKEREVFAENPSSEEFLTEQREVKSSKNKSVVSKSSKHELSSHKSDTVKNVVMRTSFPLSDILETGKGTPLVSLNEDHF